MDIYPDDVRVTPWEGPLPMETGAPEPCVFEQGDDLWVVYLAVDPLFPGWDAPDAADYVSEHPGETFGVLRFRGVIRHSLGPPSDETLDRHPLFGRGLDSYAFHSVSMPDGSTQWIATFHDETLHVTAEAAEARGEVVFAASAREAFERVRSG